jgi:hypothetical protein
MIVIYNNGWLTEITISFEIGKVKKLFYKIIDMIYLCFGKGYYWIDCGYCEREKGQLKCRAPGPVFYDKQCLKEKCDIFGDD